jgi:hypothetical protein
MLDTQVQTMSSMALIQVRDLSDATVAAIRRIREAS